MVGLHPTPGPWVRGGDYYDGCALEFHDGRKAYRMMTDGGVWIRQLGAHDGIWHDAKHVPGATAGLDLPPDVTKLAYIALNNWRKSLSGQWVKCKQLRKAAGQRRDSAPRKHRNHPKLRLLRPHQQFTQSQKFSA